MIVEKSEPVAHLVTQIYVQPLGVEEPRQPEPRQARFLAGGVPSIPSQRHPIHATVPDGIDALPARIVIEIGGQGGVEIAEQDHLRVPGQDLLDRHRADRWIVAGRIPAASQSNIEIIEGALPADAQQIYGAVEIEHARLLRHWNASQSCFEIASCLELSIEQSFGAAFLAGDQPHDPDIRCEIVPCSCPHPQHGEAGTIQYTDHVAARVRPLKHQIRSQREDCFHIRRKVRRITAAHDHVRLDAGEIRKHLSEDTFAHRACRKSIHADHPLVAPVDCNEGRRSGDRHENESFGWFRERNRVTALIDDFQRMRRLSKE